jgi:hypothetical protein
MKTQFMLKCWHICLGCRPIRRCLCGSDRAGGYTGIDNQVNGINYVNLTVWEHQLVDGSLNGVSGMSALTWRPATTTSKPMGQYRSRCWLGFQLCRQRHPYQTTRGNTLDNCSVPNNATGVIQAATPAVTWAYRCRQLQPEKETALAIGVVEHYAAVCKRQSRCPRTLHNNYPRGRQASTGHPSLLAGSTAIMRTVKAGGEMFYWVSGLATLRRRSTQPVTLAVRQGRDLNDDGVPSKRSCGFTGVLSTGFKFRW